MGGKPQCINAKQFKLQVVPRDPPERRHRTSLRASGPDSTGSRHVCLATMPIYRTPGRQVNGCQTPFAKAEASSSTACPYRLRHSLHPARQTDAVAARRGRRPGETRKETSPQTPRRWGPKPARAGGAAALAPALQDTGRLRPAPARGPVRPNRRLTLAGDVRGSPSPATGWLTEWRTPIRTGFHDFRGSGACAGHFFLPVHPVGKPLYSNHLGLVWQRGFNHLRCGR